MKIIGRARKIFDLYEWLPGHGENGVSIRTDGHHLIVNINYERGPELCERELRFSSVCTFYSQSFPGPTMLNFLLGPTDLILTGVLIEYTESEFISAWRTHLNTSITIQHYCLILLSENVFLSVIGGDVTLTDPIII